MTPTATPEQLEHFARKARTKEEEHADALLAETRAAIYHPGLRLHEIHPSPLQNRQRFDPGELSDLAASIREQGVIEPILVRPTDAGTYEILAGERRWRASIDAEQSTIPAIVRHGLTDAEAREIILVENLQRSDLSPLEKARGFQGMIDDGCRQREIARKIGRDESFVSNALRLLRLPDSVQALIEAGKLSESHGRTLARIADFPEICARIAELAAEKGIASKELERVKVPFDWQLEHEKLIIRNLDQRAKFDVKATCTECPYQAFRREGEYSSYCLKPDHFHELQQAAQAEALEEAKRLAERAKTQGNERVQQKIERALAPASPAPGTPAAPAGEREVPEGIIDLSKLSWDAYEQLTGSRPEGCNGDCPCLAKGLCTSGAVVDICLDPPRLRSLRARMTREEGKERKERFAAVREEIRAKLLYPDEATPESLLQTARQALALVAWQAIKTSRSAAKKAAAADSGDEEIQKIFTMPLEFRQETFWGTLANRMTLDGIIALGAETLLVHEIEEALEYRKDTLPMADWFLGRVPPAGSKEVATSAPEHLCEVCEERPPATDEGFCLTCIQQGMFDGNADQCDLCVGDLPASLGVPCPRRYTNSVGVVTAKGTILCPDCAEEEGLRFCLCCGATDAVLAEQGVAWAAEDRCGSCASDASNGEGEGG
ncbi:MAG: ParB/RepB/Spo0J family partition protein [Armatimonadetes bacterium]|nr:ParB/RepB/Spo0J family partition protein [Armatimonadota bacterium]